MTLFIHMKAMNGVLETQAHHQRLVLGVVELNIAGVAPIAILEQRLRL